jgi:hypothetical protein
MQSLYQADPAVDVFLLLEKFKREFGIEDVDFAQSYYQKVRTVGDIETAVNAHLRK